MRAAETHVCCGPFGVKNQAHAMRAKTRARMNTVGREEDMVVLQILLGGLRAQCIDTGTVYLYIQIWIMLVHGMAG